jgi:peptidyl-prolyl cis-trans isomerase SurA
MKARISGILALLFLLSFPPSIMAANVIEEIYAIVNDEIITSSELRGFEKQMTRAMQAQYEGQKLADALKETKKNLLNLLIEQKVIQSRVKEKNYNVDADVELILQEIKKQNNMSSDDDLKKALKSEGIEFNDFKEQQKERRKQQRLIWDEIGSKIKVDNSQIMDSYRKNLAKYTIPEEISLNCIYLKNEGNPEQLKKKKELISAELKTVGFEDIAKKYSELGGTGDSVFLGKFKKGELNQNLEEAAQKLKKGEQSSWIETDKGWYIIQLKERMEAKLMEYKDVRDEISESIRQEIEQGKMKDYVEQLKKESYIKIFKQYDGSST